tara:strand:- start:2088 stop:2432 length:345 start_codon:yes stop_codon:yes gene_type:complete
VSNAKLLERIEEFETQFGEQLGVLRTQLNSLERINNDDDEDVSTGIEQATEQLATLQAKLVELTGEWNNEIGLLRAALTETMRRVDFIVNSMFGNPVAENESNVNPESNGQVVS